MNTRSAIARLVFGIAALLAGCHSVSPLLGQAGSQTIHHTVYFELKHPAGSEAERLFFARLDSLESIPVVEGFRRVREISPKNPFQHGLMMRFADRAAYEAYNEHPDHVRFVEEVWIPGVASFQEIDFLVTRSWLAETDR